MSRRSRRHRQAIRQQKAKNRARQRYSDQRWDQARREDLAIVRYQLMTVDTPWGTLGSVWERKGGRWQCVRAADELDWMIGMPAGEVARKVKEDRLTFRWTKLRNDFILTPKTEYLMRADEAHPSAS